MGLIIEVTGDTRTTRLENFSSVASGLLSIGRARDNDLILDDPYVDPYHGQIIFGETGTWSYQDLGSENGSKRGKESVNDCALTSADVLTLGKTRLQFFDPSHRSTSTVVTQLTPALAVVQHLVDQRPTAHRRDIDARIKHLSELYRRKIRCRLADGDILRCILIATNHQCGLVAAGESFVRSLSLS